MRGNPTGRRSAVSAALARNLGVIDPTQLLQQYREDDATPVVRGASAARDAGSSLPNSISSPQPERNLVAASVIPASQSENRTLQEVHNLRERQGRQGANPIAMERVGAVQKKVVKAYAQAARGEEVTPFTVFTRTPNKNPVEDSAGLFSGVNHVDSRDVIENIPQTAAAASSSQQQQVSRPLGARVSPEEAPSATIAQGTKEKPTKKPNGSCVIL